MGKLIGCVDFPGGDKTCEKIRMLRTNKAQF